MNIKPRVIYCCGCSSNVLARLTDGKEIYPHRTDLQRLPFWKCDTCGNFVGCHHKTLNRTQPLGCIPTPEIKELRKRIHTLLDPIWKSGRIQRDNLYDLISKQTGYDYHTANICSNEDAETIYHIIKNINTQLKNQHLL